MDSYILVSITSKICLSEVFCFDNLIYTEKLQQNEEFLGALLQLLPFYCVYPLVPVSPMWSGSRPRIWGSFFPFGLCHVLSRIDTGYTVWKECHANAATLLPVQRVYRAEDIAKSLWEMVPYTVAYYGTEISENS